MKPDRLNALTDGVVAIAITIVVLELPVPETSSVAGLKAILPLLSAYLLSFINIGIFWNNHHHMMMTVKHVDGRVLWPNLGLLFFISLVPFVIRWIDAAGFETWPVAGYGVVLLGAAISYNLLERAIVAIHGHDGTLARAIGDDWKGKLSALGYLAAIGLAFVQPFIAIGIYILISAVWFIPDARIEREVTHKPEE